MLYPFSKPVSDERLIGNRLHSGQLLDSQDLKWIDLDRYVFQGPFPFARQDLLTQTVIKNKIYGVIGNLF
jgi:hypothetical protein